MTTWAEVDTYKKAVSILCDVAKYHAMGGVGLFREDVVREAVRIVEPAKYQLLCGFCELGDSHEQPFWKGCDCANSPTSIYHSGHCSLFGTYLICYQYQPIPILAGRKVT